MGPAFGALGRWGPGSGVAGISRRSLFVAPFDSIRGETRAPAHRGPGIRGMARPPEFRQGSRSAEIAEFVARGIVLRRGPPSSCPAASERLRPARRSLSARGDRRLSPVCDGRSRASAEGRTRAEVSSREGGLCRIASKDLGTHSSLKPIRIGPIPHAESPGTPGAMRWIVRRIPTRRPAGGGR